MGLEAQRDRGVQGDSVVEWGRKVSERVRERKSEKCVGMEVFRDSPWTDSDMGTHSGPNEAWPPLADFIGLGWRGEERNIREKRRCGSGTGPFC